MAEPPPPFALINSPNIPELLYQLNVTLVISTYQAGKLIFVSAQDEEKMVQLPRSFSYMMAVGIDGDRMALATRDEVIVLVNSPGLAPSYPKQPDTYDSLFVPRVVYNTGRLDIHGFYWQAGQLHTVNTLFSCLCRIDDTYSFVPVWKPPFITELAPEDRCHLNGVADKNGEPLFVTAFGTGDSHRSWVENIPDGGIVIHVPTGEIVAGDLQMPHTPRLYNGKLYTLLSATSELICVDTEKGTYDVVKKFDGFVRGMAKHQDYLFIAYSKIRKNSSFFRKLEVADTSPFSGVMVLHLPSASVVGKLEYRSSVDEIFDVEVLPGTRRPGILGTADDLYKQSLTTPETTYWAKPVAEIEQSDSE